MMLELDACYGHMMGYYSLLLMLANLIVAFVQPIQLDDSPMMIPDRKSDSLFNEATNLLGRIVTCDNSSDGEYKFAAETWSCYNIRVDGLHLRLYYTREIKTTSHCTDDNKGKNDLAALCRQLLAAHEINGDLWAALIVKNAACTDSNSDRMMFQQKMDKSYEWVKFQKGKGFVYTLRCMLME